MRRLAATIVSGLVFGLGLVVSGMVNPAKVRRFLDFSGNWDPSLAIVLACATVLTVLTFRLILKRARPILDSKSHVPTRNDVDYPETRRSRVPFGNVAARVRCQH